MKIFDQKFKRQNDPCLSYLIKLFKKKKFPFFFFWKCRIIYEHCMCLDSPFNIRARVHNQWAWHECRFSHGARRGRESRAPHRSAARAQGTQPEHQAQSAAGRHQQSPLPLLRESCTTLYNGYFLIILYFYTQNIYIVFTTTPPNPYYYTGSHMVRVLDFPLFMFWNKNCSKSKGRGHPYYVSTRTICCGCDRHLPLVQRSLIYTKVFFCFVSLLSV